MPQPLPPLHPPDIGPKQPSSPVKSRVKKAGAPKLLTLSFPSLLLTGTIIKLETPIDKETVESDLGGKESGENQT